MEDLTPETRVQKAETLARELAEEVERRRSSEKRLSQITTEWMAVFDALPELISVVDSEHRLRRVNRALADFLGCRPQDVVGRKCYEVMHGLDHPWEDCPHMASLREGRTVTKIVEDSAIGCPLAVTCSPYPDFEGQTGCTVHVARDITAERKAQQEREALIAELQEALSQVKVLSGLVPICAWCKKVRDDSGYWQRIETYLQQFSQAKFSHGLCPDCAKEVRKEF